MLTSGWCSLLNTKLCYIQGCHRFGLKNKDDQKKTTFICIMFDFHVSISVELMYEIVFTPLVSK